MSASSIQKQIFSFFLTILTVTLIFPSIGGWAQMTETELESDYETKRLLIERQISSLNKNFENLTKDYNHNSTQKKTLSAQVSSMESEIAKVDLMIVDTKVIVNQLDLEIKAKEQIIQKLNGNIRQILKEIQIRNQISPLQLIFSSKNLGSALGEMYTLSSLESKANELKADLEKQTTELENNQKKHQQIEEQLEKSRSILKNKQSNLAGLLEMTQGKESKYEALLQSLEEQKKELDGQLKGVKGEYLSELNELREKEREKYDFNTKNFNTSCPFEELRKLDVANDYFGKATDGYITQNYHCGHDGVDIANAMGTNLYAVADGEIVRKGPPMDYCVGKSCNGGFGNYVVIKHTLPSGERVYSMHAHMQHESSRQIGDFVQKGDVVGYMGCSGFTKPYPCGVHTHFVLFSQSYEQTGLGCRLGASKCLNPQKYIKNLV